MVVTQETDGWSRSPRSQDPSDTQPKGAKKKKKRREMKVRDLGQGYESDEIVLFKFCLGSCEPSRNNYDLALSHLLNGTLPRHTALLVASQPCCRPDRYESVSFMDTSTPGGTIEKLSAASCMCMAESERKPHRTDRKRLATYST
ncbi:LOW QUALITY PROTEIN: artemin-like [Aplochiton taeniatus]